MTQGEWKRILVQFNDTGVDYPRDVCLHELFEAQVQRTPDKVALTFDDSHLTFCELNQRANQLAYQFQSLGVGPEVLLSVFMERSLEMVLALYGILKTGGGLRTSGS